MSFEQAGRVERKVYWQDEPTGEISACIAGDVEFFRNINQLTYFLEVTYPEWEFELVEVTEDTWLGFYQQGVFFDDWQA